MWSLILPMDGETEFIKTTGLVVRVSSGELCERLSIYLAYLRDTCYATFLKQMNMGYSTTSYPTRHIPPRE
jgi:hypothetical protein